MFRCCSRIHNIKSMKQCIVCCLIDVVVACHLCSLKFPVNIILQWMSVGMKMIKLGQKHFDVIEYVIYIVAFDGVYFLH